MVEITVWICTIKNLLLVHEDSIKLYVPILSIQITIILICVIKLIYDYAFFFIFVSALLNLQLLLPRYESICVAEPYFRIFGIN